mmetsp:Transcript_18386/g.39500  ORF Transcript_18386/g.39500 Transcript_18386/m.39500 type:complete len:605 (-) Transcript_18386:318-2132(-)
MPSSLHPPPKSPFLAPRHSSSYGGGIGFLEQSSGHSANTVSTASDTEKYNIVVEPEHKSTIIGCTANLITAIVGAGIIGIPYAMRETGLMAGWLLILLSGTLGCKSLRLLIETAKHVDAASYEVLSETVFGQTGWAVCNILMFVMSWGPMLSYLMLVKDTLGSLTGYDGSICLIVSSVLVMLPLCLQRDMADLAKTSRVSVLFNICMVSIIATYSPTSQSISDAGGFSTILLESSFRPATCFVGLGILSFAFSCQHSSLIIAGSLENPTRERWNKVSWAALAFCSVLAIIMGSFGYVAYREDVEGNILKNFDSPATAANIARGLICSTMFCVFPLESFVARHVIMENLFQGREAHDGDDHAVLDRWDRRVATTIALYLSVLIPALYCDDVGLVLAWTGTVAATSLSYIGPGVLFIGVHGEEFLDLVQNNQGPGLFKKLLQNLLLVPLWCKVASTGKSGLTHYYDKKEMMTPAEGFRLGKVKHKREMMKNKKERRSKDNFLSEGAFEAENESLRNKMNIDAEETSVELGLITTTVVNRDGYGSIASNLTKKSELQHEVADTDSGDGEDDPQDEKQTTADFALAIGFVFFGVTAFIAGIFSIYKSG